MSAFLEMIYLSICFAVCGLLCSEDDLVSMRGKEDVVSAEIWDSLRAKTCGKNAFSGLFSIQFIAEYVQKP